MTSMLGDAAVTLIIIVFAIFVIDFLLVVYWRYKVNGKYYASPAGSERPNFSPLPSILSFPNLELTILTAFMTGLVKASFAVYGAYAGKVEISTGLWTMAAVMSAFLLLFFGFYARELASFKRDHVNKVWKPNTANETDDPLMKMLAKLSCGLIKTAPRKRGSFKPPEEWNTEPARTEMLTARVLFWLPKPTASSEMQAGMKCEVLASWISDGSGDMRYKIVSMVLQMILTFVISLFNVVKTQSNVAKNTCFILIVCVQVSTLLWHFCGQPVDRLKGLFFALGSLLELIVVSFTFAASLLNDARRAEAAEIGKVGPAIMLCHPFAVGPGTLRFPVLTHRCNHQRRTSQRAGLPEDLHRTLVLAHHGPSQGVQDWWLVVGQLGQACGSGE